MQMLVTVEDMGLNADDVSKFLSSTEGSHIMKELESRIVQRVYDRLKSEGLSAVEERQTIAMGVRHEPFRPPDTMAPASHEGILPATHTAEGRVTPPGLPSERDTQNQATRANAEETRRSRGATPHVDDKP